LLGTVFLLLSSGVLAQSGPPLPYESKGLCPFECCTYSKNWVVEKTIQVLTDRKLGSPVAFTLQKGEKVEGVTGVVVTTAMGLAKGIPFNPKYPGKFKPGAEVPLLAPLGEGCYKAWVRGKGVDACSDDIAEPLRAPKTEWWVQLKTSKGQVGWVRWPDGEEYFSNVDACG